MLVTRQLTVAIDIQSIVYTVEVNDYHQLSRIFIFGWTFP